MGSPFINNFWKQITNALIDTGADMSSLLSNIYNTIHSYHNIPIGSALECEASILRSIHNSGELKSALRGPTTCSDPVGIWTGEVSYS